MWQYWLAGIALAFIVGAAGYGLGSRIAIERMIQTLGLLEDSQEVLDNALALMSEVQGLRDSRPEVKMNPVSAQEMAARLAARPLGTLEQQREAASS